MNEDAKPSLTNSDEVEWNLIATARRVFRARWRLILATLIGVALGAAYAFLLKPYYQAQAVFLPPKSTDASAAGPGGGANFLLGTTDLSDTYLGMLGSRSVADDVIDHLDLMNVYHAKERIVARTLLGSASRFSVSKNALIQVTVTAGDPKLAPKIANAYLEALYRLSGQMAGTASEHRRVFFEDQLQQQKAALDAAEVDLKNTQQRTGVVLPSCEEEAGLQATPICRRRSTRPKPSLPGWK